MMLLMQLLFFFFLIQSQSLFKRDFNPKVLSPPHSQAMLFYVCRFVPSIPYLISMDLLASWGICDGNVLTSPLFFFPWHLFCVTSRGHTVGLGQREQMTQVLLVQAVVIVARPAWLFNRLSDSGRDAVCLDEHRVPDSNLSIFSNTLFM